MELELEEVKRFSLAALHFVQTGEPEKASLVVEALSENGGAWNLYAACCGWALSSFVSLEKIHGEHADGLWTFEEIHPGELADDPQKTFALRFIAAFCNEDPATTEALFLAAARAGSDALTGSLAALLQMAADLSAEAPLADGGAS